MEMEEDDETTDTLCKKYTDIFVRNQKDSITLDNNDSAELWFDIYKLLKSKKMISGNV